MFAFLYLSPFYSLYAKQSNRTLKYHQLYISVLILQHAKMEDHQMSSLDYQAALGLLGRGPPLLCKCRDSICRGYRKEFEFTLEMLIPSFLRCICEMSLQMCTYPNHDTISMKPSFIPSTPHRNI